MTKISAIIITYNEEENIGRCIDSLIPVADEILIVDSYSKDKTKEECVKRNVRFIEHPFIGHVEQKNYALENATYDHVISLDGDEYLSEELAQSILKVKENLNCDGYYFNRLSSYEGKWKGTRTGTLIENSDCGIEILENGEAQIHMTKLFYTLSRMLNF
ncbi:MAG: glycosyltransferase family 2 protein [Bacteroidia bacterium]|nr:glycosyltransferase family 2 protein [Bacteroidia bacterium]